VNKTWSGAPDRLQGNCMVSGILAKIHRTVYRNRSGGAPDGLQQLFPMGCWRQWLADITGRSSGASDQSGAT
jgi:hypothetical protein